MTTFKPVAFRLDDATRAELEAMASKLRITQAAVMRQAIREMAERVLIPPPTTKGDRDAEQDKPAD